MIRSRISAAALASLLAGAAFGHGDVAPQPVDTDSLPDVGEDWLYENPYRSQGSEVWAEAVRVGASGYNQNCARCHGLEVVSGGLAPDLRYLEADEFGDEWFLERFQSGYTQNGVTKMPAFGELLGQKAAWAIRTYIETRPEDGAVEEYGDSLAAIRDELSALAGAEMPDSKIAVARDKLTEIAGKIGTASGAPFADSAAFRAASALEDGRVDVKLAFEALTIGLSKAN